MVASIGDDSYMHQLLRGEPLKGECTTNSNSCDMKWMNEQIYKYLQHIYTYIAMLYLRNLSRIAVVCIWVK
jgi:hypothetical protein